MSTAKRPSRLLEFLLIFAIVYLGTQMVSQWLFPHQESDTQPTGVELRMVDATVKGDHHPEVTIRNNTDQPLVLVDRCPMPPFDVTFSHDRAPYEQITTEEFVLSCDPVPAIEPGASAKISLAPWKYSLFSEYGDYQLALPQDDPEADAITASFSYSEVGIVTQTFRSFVTKPLLNLLILIASYTPGYNLGIAIIILTLIVKLALFFPTQHAMESQKKMQVVQPKLDEIKKKYSSNPQKMQAETLKIWKEHKINPFGSCLPLLLQFPVLIGLFFVIRDGVVLELSRHLLYSPYQDLSWAFGTQFLGLDLNVSNGYIMAPILVMSQFFQMKLSFARAKRKQEKVDMKKNKKGEFATAMQTQQKVMMYGLPLMIGVFSFQFPVAVSLYWFVSTVFAIGQQLIVNREKFA